MKCNTCNGGGGNSFGGRCPNCNGKGYFRAYNSSDVDRLIQLSIQLCKESTNSILKKEAEELIKEINYKGL